MRHRMSGKRLSRTASHRKAMRRNMAASLFEHGAVKTTLTKAKELRPFVERLITIARTGTLHARRRVIALLGDRAMADKEDPGELTDQTVVQLLFSDVAPRYVDRPGGYTRIIRLPERRIGDGSQQVLLQLVEETSVTASDDEETATVSRRRRRAGERADHVRSTVEEDAPDEEPETEDTEADEEEAEDADAPEESADDASEGSDSDAEEDEK